ncbi:hypothetical protein NIES2111_53140 [Nostoc sp. NIES-2111]|nr:hypothetical protein NIES2111_53140 [Nostoc sp. NIES-2111]
MLAVRQPPPAIKNKDMIKSSKQNPSPQIPRRSLWLLILTRGGVAIGGLLIVALMGGIWRLWTFVQKELTPLAQEGLTSTLNRPVKLGRVTGFSLTGVQFAASSIPATPTDPDKVTVDAVEVGFNPLLLVFNRQLKLNVTLINPNVYVEQDDQGRWLTTKIASQSQKGGLKTDVDNIYFRNGKLMLLPQVRNLEVGGVGSLSETLTRTTALTNRKRGVGNVQAKSSSPLVDEHSRTASLPSSLPPVGFSQLNGTAKLLEKNQLINFKAIGIADSGGKIDVEGLMRLKTTATNMQLRGQELLAADITRLVKIPLVLETGRVNGDLRIQFAPGEKALLYGSADLQKVTLHIPRTPQAFNNTHGNLYFQGTEVKLENIFTNYGSIPVVAAGIIDTEAGFKLTGRVNSVSVGDAQKTLKLKLPFPVAGQLQANLQVIGAANNPILSGTVNTINTARIDKVDFQSVSSKFEFSPQERLVTLKDVQGKTTVGGVVTGGGRVLLGENPQLNLSLRARNIAGDAIAKLYNTNTSFKIGTVAATAQVIGAPTNVKTFVNFTAPQAAYPATGEVIVGANRNFNFRNVTLSVGGGTVQGYGSFANERWQAVADASRVSLTPFVNQNQLQNISLAGAQFNGRLILTGTATPFQISSIRTQGAGVQIGGGTIAVSNIQLQDKAFAAKLVANNVRLSRILKNALPALANPIAGTFQVAGNRENFSLKTLQALGDARLSVGKGNISASNIQLANGVYQAQVQANNVPVQRLATLPRQFQGNLTGKFAVTGSTESFSPQSIQATGQGRLDVGSGTITAANIQLANGLYQAQLQADNVPVQRLAAVPPKFQSNLTGQFNVAGSTASFSPKTIQASGQGRLDIGNGTITATNIQLANGNYQAQVQASNVPVQRLATVPPKLQGNLTGQLDLAGSATSFSIQSIQGTGQGRLDIGSGTITATNIQLANGNYQAQVQANNVPVQRLATVPPQLQGNLTGQLNVAGSLTSFNPQSIQARGQGQLNIAGGGVINASNIQLAKGSYQAVVAAAGVQLNQFNQRLRGLFGGQLQLAGNLGSTRLADVRAAGQVQLSQGLPGVERPLNAAIAWNGERLTIQQATAPGLSVNGDILANANKPGIPTITALNLNVQAQDFNLQQLPLNFPNQVAVAGRVDFNGQVTGRLPVPNINGQFLLKDLVVENIAFEPLLTGYIQSAPGQGLNFNLAGKSDRLALNLDSNNRPQSFLVQWREALASGQVRGDDWAVKVANFPLQILNLSPPPNLRLGSSKIAGVATGNLQFNQRTFASTGNIAIANPEVGRLKGNSLAAQFRYGNGTTTITNSEFTKGKSRYALVGNFGQTPQGPRIQGKLNVSQGQVQDVLTVAQIFDLQDFQRNGAEPNYGSASDLITYPQGLPNQPLYDQINRLSEINALNEKREQERNASAIPNLADLRGTFNAEVAVDNTTANGLAVQFNLNGQNFTWGKEEEQNRFYRAENIIAEGSFANGVLQLRPVRIELQNNSLLAFTGNIGGNEQSGQLRINNFPIELLNNFVNLPIGVTGNLSGSAALAGSIANPQAKGEWQITDGTLNQKPIESAVASFSYSNARLNFGSTVAIAGPQPVNITGSIPYQLPFASVPPESENIRLDVKVENEGLALLNLLSNQVAFEAGQGEVDLTVRGTRQQPEVNGIATVKDATFSAQALPEKVKGVTGKVLFNFDQVLVESLQGRFSRGQVQAAGEIPIFNSDRVAVNNPLTVNLDQLKLNLKGLYQGGASGNIQITGSALNPKIGGKVNLYDGQVLLAESSDNQPANTTSGIYLTKFNKQNSNTDTKANTSFSNLELELGNNVQITRPPLLSFTAKGSLRVNGSFADPIPVGTIQLTKGGVNLFTTQFNLARGYEHTATFRANQPRDPDLDIQLLAKVLEVIPSNDLNRNNAVGLGALETVRVEANIKGPASRLNETLELRSSPARSQTELVALLGGGFVDTQGRGDSTLGLINIAGSAVFGNFQSAFNQIGNAFGLSELRIFPTVISDNPDASNNSGRNGSSIELAAEAGIDISNKLSISSIKILTANDPFQWGINYRINDKFRVRASTNLEDDSRAVVEFQSRF